ncbi:MAG: HD domain-containing phosphohydrolase [Acidobacteriota bacterium]
MQAHPKLKEIDLLEFQEEFDLLVVEYFSVRVRNFFPGSVTPCDIHYPAVNRAKKTFFMEKLLGRDELYASEFHDAIRKEDIGEFYIRIEDEDAYLEYFASHVQKAMASEAIPPETKTQLIYDNAECIVKKAFKDHPTVSNINMGKKLVESFAVHLGSDQVTHRALFSLFSKDYYTFTHCVQVAMLGMAFCRFLDWSQEEVSSFGLGALFHDVGKNAVDLAILNKPTRLAKEEFELVKKHTLFGFEQLKETRIISSEQLSIVLHHHEAMDGSGYPQGFSGDRIHKFARVARIVDCYDALTTKRCYKDALPPAKVIRIMTEEMGPTFDRALLESFIKFLKSGEAKSAARLNQITIEVGTQLMIQFGSHPERFRASLVGLEAGEFLILRIPEELPIQLVLQQGRPVVSRYALAGTVYGFKTVVLSHTLDPVRLLFLSYPRTIEKIELRKDRRIECFFPAEVQIEQVECAGVVTDISVGGCKISVKHAGGIAALKKVVGGSIALRTQLFGDDRPRPFYGKVRNVSGAQGKIILGVQFVNLNNDALGRITRCIKSVLNLVE